MIPFGSENSECSEFRELKCRDAVRVETLSQVCHNLGARLVQRDVSEGPRARTERRQMGIRVRRD